MKYLRNGSIALLLLLLPAFTFAAEQHKSVTLDQDAMVGAQQLKPGQYTLKWDDSQNTTSVNFQQNGKTVATAQAQVVRQPSPKNADFEINGAGGQPQLRRVYISKEQLVFGPTTQADNTSTPPSQ